MTPAEEVAKSFHEAYERLAPSFGYKTRDESAVPWEQVPEQNKMLMIAVAEEVSKGMITVQSLFDQLEEWGGAIATIAVRDGEDRAIRAVVAVEGIPEAEDILAAVERVQTVWDAERDG